MNYFKDFPIKIDWLEFSIQDFKNIELVGHFLFESFDFNIFLKESPRAARESLLSKNVNQYETTITVYSFSDFY